MAPNLLLCPNKCVGNDHPTFIIAEVGQNHQGSLETAKLLIKTAKVIIPGKKLINLL